MYFCFWSFYVFIIKKLKVEGMVLLRYNGLAEADNSSLLLPIIYFHKKRMRI